MSLSKQEIKDLLLAGKIAHLTLDKIMPQVKTGLPIADIFDYIVKIITVKYKAELAFPPNISINDCAAHDSAGINEKRIIPPKAVVKIDIGVNVNGMLSDTARTVSTSNRHAKLIKSANMALEKAIETVKPGIKVGDIGEAVQDTIEEFGFKPIQNLTGHLIEKGTLHAGLSVPNVKSAPFSHRGKLKKGMIVAIEPFSTNGKAGYVTDSSSSPALIYSSNGNPKTEIGKLLVKRYKKLPFALRTADKYLKSMNIKYKDLASILNKDNFYSYKPLIEASGGIVAQAEHTIIVTTNGAKIIT